MHEQQRRAGVPEIVNPNLRQLLTRQNVRECAGHVRPSSGVPIGVENTRPQSCQRFPAISLASNCLTRWRLGNRIGIRMALGAQAHQIRALFPRRGLIVATIVCCSASAPPWRQRHRCDAVWRGAARSDDVRDHARLARGRGAIFATYVQRDARCWLILLKRCGPSSKKGSGSGGDRADRICLKSLNNVTAGSPSCAVTSTF